jgi:probable phosphoglycerate mutase
MPVYQACVIRHGETEWSVNGRHTGITDIPLTENGRRMARELEPLLVSAQFTLVLTSPLQRARETCRLAGLGSMAEVDPDLIEWNYGDYEGLTPHEIRARRPDWMIFRDGCPGGESPEDVGARVDRVIARLRATDGRAALFGHGHLFRVFAARWIELPASAGRRFLLDPATLGVLGYYQGEPALKRWNAPLAPPPSQSGDEHPFAAMAAEGRR